MPKLIAFFDIDDKSKLYINPSMVAAATPEGEDQTTLHVALAHARQQFTVGGSLDAVGEKLNRAMD